MPEIISRNADLVAQTEGAGYVMLQCSVDEPQGSRRPWLLRSRPCPAARKSRRSFGFLLALKLVFDASRRYRVVEGNAEAIQKRELGGLAIYLARMPEAAGPLSPTWAGIALAL